MMARKRASVKGKGADIFLSGQDDEQDKTSKPATSARKKATFYIPSDLLERLDDAWLDMRRVERGLTKSELVTVALEEVLTDYDKQQEKSRLHRAILGKPSSDEE